MDNKTIERIQLIHPKLREEVTNIYKEICNALSGKVLCRFAYTLRSFKEQNDLYEQGRSIPNTKIVTNARGGQSYHNYGLAIDIVMVLDKDGNGTFETASWDTKLDFDGDGKSDWREVVTIFKRYGWTWGGDWKFVDAPHFEKTLGYSVAELEKKFNEKKFIENTNYLNI